MENARINMERTEALYEIGSVALVELEEAKNSVDQIENNLNINKNTYNKLTKGISKDIRSRYEAEIDLLLLTIDDLESKKSNYMIYSDIDGMVTEINTFMGDSPYAGKILLEVQDTSQKIILVDFMVEDAMEIEPGMSASIEDDELGISISDLRVSRVYPKAFETLSELGVRENRQSVEIILPPSVKDLDFGLQLNTRVIIEDKKDALLIPLGSVYIKDSKEYVRLLENGEPIEIEIRSGLKINDQIEVLEGLKEGQLVIINYQEE